MLLRKTHVNDLLAALSTQARVYVPARPSGETASRFVLYRQAQANTPAFDLVNTTMPPKDLLFPQTQKMYRYGFDDEGTAFIDTVHDADDTVLFGLRSCDMRSIECMDDVFLSKGYDDEFYSERRERLTTVAIGCAEVAETCFCDSMGLSPNVAPGADIQLSPLADGSGYRVGAQTEKGEAALVAWSEFLERESSEDARGIEGVQDAKGAKGTPLLSTSCTLKVNAEGIKEKLDHMFEHPLWEVVSKKCITCGTCTFVCPTCHCFDISQENKMKDGERFRCWDSCMFSSYTEMAGHHNPRADKVSRVRQRFMHKLCFFEDRYGKSLCVGCGRCVEKCPVALDITVLIDEIESAVQWTAEGAASLRANLPTDTVPKPLKDGSETKEVADVA